MTQRKRSIGMYCAGVALWGLALAYFVAFSSGSSESLIVRAAEPPVPVAAEDADGQSEVTRSRTSRLLDAIRPSRLLRRKVEQTTEETEPQRLDPAQSSNASSIPMRPLGEQSRVQHPSARQTDERIASDRDELPFELLQTAASRTDQRGTGRRVSCSRRTGDG
jgi:hypothetical protein